MTGKERVLAMFDGKAVEHLPLMPITMLFGAGLAGVPYRDYAAGRRGLAEVQSRVHNASRASRSEWGGRGGGGVGDGSGGRGRGGPESRSRALG